MNDPSGRSPYLKRLWHFAAMSEIEQTIEPDPFDTECDAGVSDFGYAERFFGQGQPHAQYGFA